MKKALVTGGAGFVGSHLCEALLNRGYRVTVIDDLSTGRRENIAGLRGNKRFRFIRGTILNKRKMSALIKDCDIVFHLAAAVGVQYILEHPVDSILTNITGTEIILELADRFRKKILITSTSEVYGKHVCAPFREEDNRILGSTSVSRWSYSDAKAIDEFLALAYAKERKLPVVIVRLFNTVGPRQLGRYGMVLPRFVQAALAGKPITIYGDGTQVRSFAHVKDVVSGIIALSACRKAEGEIFNVGNEQPVEIGALARMVRDAAGSSSKIVTIPFEKAFGKNAMDFEEINCRVPNITKIKKTVGYAPRYSTEDIIRDTIAYYRAITATKG